MSIKRLMRIFERGQSLRVPIGTQARSGDFQAAVPFA